MTSILTIILDVLEGVTILYVAIIVGFIFIQSPLGKFKDQFVKFAINLVLPMLIFVSFLTIEISADVFYPTITGIIVIFAGIWIPRLMATLMKQEEPSSAELCTATFPNSINYPFPIIFAFAPAGLGIASIFVAINIIARNTIGFWLSGYGLDRRAFTKIVSFIPIYGIVAGGMFNIFLHDQSVSIAENPITSAVLEIGIFLMTMTVGFGLTKPKLEFLQPILRVGFVRFVLMGVLSFFILLIFQPPLYVAVTTIVQLTAPPAIYNMVYAEDLGLDTELTSQLIVTLTLVALLILPLQLVTIQLLA